jgi:RHS repeat-associated protein
MSITAVGTVIARGGEAAHAMSGEPAGDTAQSSPVDVWSTSHDGLAAQMSSVARNPSAFVSSDQPAQMARAQAAATNMSPAAANQIENSMTAQASALSQTVDAVGEAHGALETVGATFGVLTGVEQLLSTALSAIPFPALPAVRIADFDIGLPHAHSHPPNLIPPAPPIPLPSMGPVIPIPILSGASTVLVNGMPAGRCGDMGLGIWCGGYFPMYEVFLGSSNVWIEGARAARMLVDITKHCLFTTPKPQDFPIGPMLGTTISSSPNVRIGGFPMPSLTALAFGAAMKGAFKIAGKGARAFARATAPLRRRMGNALNEVKDFIKCKVLRGEPVNFITGEVSVEQQDFFIPGLIPFVWTRSYGSQRTRRGSCGYGWSTEADARLVFEEDGAVSFHDGLGGVTLFPYLPSGGSVRELVGGSMLEVAHETFRVRIPNSLDYVFPRGATLPREAFVERLQDACGNFIRFIRDVDGLCAMVESAGRRIEVISKAGLVQELRIQISEHRQAQVLARYEYSEDGELLAAYDALGKPLRFEYEHRRLVAHTNRNGLSFHYEYDSTRQSARCVKAWGDGGLYSYTFAFDPVAKRVTTTNSLGATSIAQLDDLGLPVWEMDPLGGITKYEYDDRGRTVAVTDRDGNGSRYRYDESGNRLELTRADGSTLRTTFDDQGRPLTITDPNGGQWTQKWDARGLLLERVSPLGSTTRYEYDPRGLLVAFTNANGARSEMAFDDMGNVIRATDALGCSTRYGYDVLGNLTASVDALNRKTHYRYDAKSRLTEVRLPSGAFVSCEYDDEDDLTRHTDARGATIHFEYYGLGLLKRRRQSDGHVVEYGYDTEERLVSVTNQRGETYRLKRDALGRVVEEVDYWGQALTLGFDARGHLKQSHDALGRVIHFTTDKMGRVRTKRYAHPFRADRFAEESFEYDAAGYLVGCANEHGRVQLRFDADGRLVEEMQGDFVVRNSYDAVGNRVRRETSGGNAVAYRYDLFGRVTSIAINDEPPIQIERDEEGQVRKETLGARLERFYTYDADGRVTRQGIKNKNSDWLFDTQYQYDAAGNLTLRRDSAYGTDVYDYDPVGQLMQHTDPQGKLARFFQDPAGDRLQTEVTLRDEAGDEWSRRGQYGGVRYGFDRAGQLTHRAGERAATALTWDANHRLVQSESGGVATRYGYDPLGRRVFKQTGTTTTRFHWDGNAILAEEDESRGVREYVHYPATFEPLALLEARPGRETEAFYYSNDPNGCPTRVVAASGAIVWAARYTPWGEATVLVGDPAFNPIRLQGQYADAETGLHYNRHRYYDPVIGQFISQDPIGLLAGTNFYQYAPNALSWVDPLGLDTHYLTAWIERNGQEAPGTRENVFSGGKNEHDAGRWGLKSHTEPKYLDDYGKKLQPDDVLHMQGTRDPCKPGCQPLLRDLANGDHVVDDLKNLNAPATKTVYHASDTGRTWTFRKAEPGEFGSLKGEVVVERVEANGRRTVRRYWRPPKGGWTSARVKIGCGG